VQCLYLFMFDTMRYLKWKTMLAAILLLSVGFANKTRAQQKFNKAAFYNVMDTSNVAGIDAELSVVKASSLADADGYEGALLMRKAGKVSGAKKKLDLFKAGRIKLETAIIADPDNTEFRFLRLAIEENAPKIVKYHNDIEKDKLMVLKNYKILPPSVQHAIINYAKKSKVLHESDF
jgi:hypothetical protein